jgi:hypothetical protein
MKKISISSVLILAATPVFAVGIFVGKVAADNDDHDHFNFRPGTLVLSRSVYIGTASSITVCETLPPNCVAGNVQVPLLVGGTASVAVSCGSATFDGTFPTVFNNDASDGSFGITSPIFLDELTTDGEPTIGEISRRVSSAKRRLGSIWSTRPEQSFSSQARRRQCRQRQQDRDLRDCPGRLHDGG